jgi:hypothetical protein
VVFPMKNWQEVGGGEHILHILSVVQLSLLTIEKMCDEKNICFTKTGYRFS